MTHNEMLGAIDRIMAQIEATIANDPNIPRKTGNLASSVKVRKVSDGYEIYVETGALTTSEWEKTPIKGEAPYAIEVENRTPF